ncbi:MAG: type II secretion system protein M [Burkholderiaceae bacterium]|nr:type II secretion system protein M [Burkholderiaceae bacterium]MEB2317689.1 type II secretion system protein M [Pseudomonadota bacterium]
MLESFLGWWRERQPRERRILAAGTAILLVALVWLLAFEPAWLGRQRLAEELPVQRAALARMASMIEEARALESVAGVAPASGSVRASLEKSLAAAGLDNGVQIEQRGDRYDLRFPSVPFAAWIDWVALSVRESRVRVIDARLTRDPRDGYVAARLSVQASEGGR